MKLALALLVACTVVLFGGAFFYLGLQSATPTDTLLPPGQLRGSAVVYNALPYTLNFSQQEELLSILNDGTKVKRGSHTPETETTITLYRFNDTPPITLTPLNADFSLFAVSTWKRHALQISEPEKLQELLPTTHAQ